MSWKCYEPINYKLQIQIGVHYWFMACSCLRFKKYTRATPVQLWIKKYDTSRGQLNTLQMPVSVIWEHVRENTFLSKLCIGSKLFYTVKNWSSSFFNNVNLRLTVFSFTSAKLVWQQSHYAKLKKYWIIYLESYVFANSLSRNIFREIAKKKELKSSKYL